MVINPKYRARIDELKEDIVIMESLISYYKKLDLTEHYYKKSLGIREE